MRSLVYVCGVATDYCVQASVMDALRDGFNVGVVIDCVAGVNEVSPYTIEHRGGRESRAVDVETRLQYRRG